MTFAARAGVAAPSLFKHVDGLADLRAFLRGYRQYALEFPHRYAAMPQDPYDDPEPVKAGDRLPAIIFSILDGCGVAGSEAVHMARCVRAVGRGFATLRIAGGFQAAENVDETYERLIGMVTAPLP